MSTTRSPADDRSLDPGSRGPGTRGRWRRVTQAPREGERRLFVAIALPAAVAGQVVQLVDRVRAEMRVEATPAEQRREVRWVRLDALHLTLRFLGPTDVARVPDVEAAVAAAACRSQPVEIGLHGAGSFPPVGRPRVLWLGLRTGSDALARLAADLNEELVTRGWASDDRHLRAHLTLARADGVAAGPHTAALLARAAAELEVAFSADRLSLFESVPVPAQPARYVPLVEVALGAGSSRSTGQGPGVRTTGG